MKIFDDENWPSEKKDKYITEMKREWGNGSLHSCISLMGKSVPENMEVMTAGKRPKF